MIPSKTISKSSTSCILSDTVDKETNNMQRIWISKKLKKKHSKGLIFRNIYSSGQIIKPVNEFKNNNFPMRHTQVATEECTTLTTSYRQIPCDFFLMFIQYNVIFPHFEFQKKGICYITWQMKYSTN